MNEWKEEQKIVGSLDMQKKEKKKEEMRDKINFLHKSKKNY